MTKTTLVTSIAAALLAAPLAASAQHMNMNHDHMNMDHKAMSGTAGHAQMNGDVQTVDMTVTSEGFVPAQVKVMKGHKVRLAITRKTDRTCATEIVVKDYGIRRELPLEKTVYVEFTPTKSGDVRYTCGMDMIAGVLQVE